MSGKKSRDKGARREREMVRRYMDIPGVFAHRVPLSGAVEGYRGDIKCYVGPHEFTCEMKARASGFQQLYKWLGTNDILHVQRDKDEPLTILPWWLWKCICEKLALEGIQDVNTIAKDSLEGPADSV
jgi:hypothetical protein